MDEVSVNTPNLFIRVYTASIVPMFFHGQGKGVHDSTFVEPRSRAGVPIQTDNTADDIGVLDGTPSVIYK